jgi:hypothetical protein
MKLKFGAATKKQAIENLFRRSQGGYVVTPDPAKHFFPRDFQNWVQTVAIFVAAGWGLYTFVFKEIWLPKAAPVNLTLNAQLQKIRPEGPGSEKASSLVPVEMKITATNPSSKEAFLLPNVWLALGKKISPRDSTLFAADVNAALGSPDHYAEQGEQVKFFEVVAAGRLFGDYSLKPGESATRTIIFHVPAKKYDQLSLVAEIPTTSEPNRVHQSWTFDARIQGLRVTMYRIDAEGNPIPILPDAQGHFNDPEDGLQSFTARAELSM